MDKSLLDKLKKAVNKLNEINLSSLPFNIDKTILNNDVKDIEYISSIWRIHFININGKIKEECQEYLNENQFAIEYEKPNNIQINTFSLEQKKDSFDFKNKRGISLSYLFF